MTTTAGRDASQLDIQYVGPALSFGGLVGADFQLHWPHQAQVECSLTLALDAREALEAGRAPLSDAEVQAVLQALAVRLYGRMEQSGRTIPALMTLRARDLSEDDRRAALVEAGIA